MSLTERDSIVRRNPYTDRRSFVARAMGLSPIGDIASGGMSESTTAPETLTWSTATDWDNFTSQTGAVHENTANTDHDDGTIVKKGFSSQNIPFETDMWSYYLLHEDSGSTANDFAGSFDGSISSFPATTSGLVGTTAFDFSGENISVDPMPNITDEWSLFFWINAANDTEDDYIFDGRIGTDKFFIQDDSQGGGLWLRVETSGGTTDYRPIINSAEGYANGNWNLITITYNSNTGDIKGYVNDTNVSTDSASNPVVDTTNGAYLVNEFSGGGNYWNEKMGTHGFVQKELSASEVTRLNDTVRGESSLTTATKSFSSNVTPDLQNLQYTLNSQTVVLDIIGSPGTASEEVVSQTLDGSASYSLTWSNSHTDFRVKPRLSTGDNTVTPSVGQIELVS